MVRGSIKVLNQAFSNLLNLSQLAEISNIDTLTPVNAPNLDPHLLGLHTQLVSEKKSTAKCGHVDHYAHAHYRNHTYFHLNMHEVHAHHISAGLACQLVDPSILLHSM